MRLDYYDCGDILINHVSNTHKDQSGHVRTGLYTIGTSDSGILNVDNGILGKECTTGCLVTDFQMGGETEK